MWWIQTGALSSIVFCLIHKFVLKHDALTGKEVISLLLNIVLWPMNLVLFAVIMFQESKKGQNNDQENKTN